ncbi:hypothetical protein K3495_g4342 [Podosphaera aphanis]|nr:hypothetical protein K3495_g4342 [Podosphaera aphanis]
MSSSHPPQKREPEVVVDIVLKRAKVGKIGRILKTRLRLAQFKTARGWEDLSIDALEPKIDEIRRQTKLNSNFDSSSETSSKRTTEQVNNISSYFMSSPDENSFIFSDHTYSEKVRERSRGSHYHECYRPRSQENFDESCFSSYSRKRHCSSSPFGSSGGDSCSSSSSVQTLGTFHAPPSPLKFCRQAHFTTTSGPSLSFYAGSSSFTRYAFDYHNLISDDENLSPINSLKTSSSSPQTPRMNHCAHSIQDPKDRIEVEGPKLLSQLAFPPSPVGSKRMIMPPSTPPPQNISLPSSMMLTAQNGSEFYPRYNDPRTPPATFDFSDYVNMTPSSVRPNHDTARPNSQCQSPGTVQSMNTVYF